MKLTNKQLTERISTLTELLNERKKNADLHAKLVIECDKKNHWEDCAKRLMLENEFLKSGHAGAVHDPHGPLQPKYMRTAPQRPWWRKLFNL